MMKWLALLWIAALVVVTYIDGAVIGQQQTLIRQMMSNPACNGRQ